jgi:DNA-binding NarL/FixJ family response regulator
VRAKRDDTVGRHDENRGRITLVATNAAFAALGIDAQETPADEMESAPNDTERAGEEPKAQRKAKSRASRTAAPRTRDGSKQAQLIAMLRRAKGATVDEIAEALSWQPHTVRGAIAGALKKKLGLEVNSEKDEKRGRVYRVTI